MRPIAALTLVLTGTVTAKHAPLRRAARSAGRAVQAETCRARPAKTTADLLRGFLDGPASVIVYRHGGGHPDGTEIKPRPGRAATPARPGRTGTLTARAAITGQHAQWAAAVPAALRDLDEAGTIHAAPDVAPPGSLQALPTPGGRAVSHPLAADAALRGQRPLTISP